MLLEQHRGRHSNEQNIPRALALERGGVWNDVARRRLIGEGHAADSLHARHILACASTHALEERVLHDDPPHIMLLHVAGMQLAWAWLAGKQMQVTLGEGCGLRKFRLVVAGADGNTKHEKDLIVMPMLLR